MQLQLARRKHSEFIQWSAVVSLTCLIIVSVSLGTDGWITATAKVVGDVEVVGDSTINYGLTKGTLIRRILTSPKAYDIHFTCIWGLNKCAWSCLAEDHNRKHELQLLINGEKPSFNCAPVTTKSLIFQPRENNGTTQLTGQFLNAGMYISTLMFIILTLISLLMCFILGILNYFTSPSETIFNILGLYITSAVAFVTNLIGVIIYGCYYDYWIKDNIGIRDTIVGEYKSTASLGYSYWILLIVIFLNPMSILLLNIRQHLLMKDRAETIIVVAKVNDPTEVLY